MKMSPSCLRTNRKLYWKFLMLRGTSDFGAHAHRRWLGHVSFWHETAVLCVPANVCSWGESGRAADITAMTDSDVVDGARCRRRIAVRWSLLRHIREPSTCRLPRSVWISPRTYSRFTAST